MLTEEILMPTLFPTNSNVDCMKEVETHFLYHLDFCLNE